MLGIDPYSNLDLPEMAAYLIAKDASRVHLSDGDLVSGDENNVFRLDVSVYEADAMHNCRTT